MGKTHNSEAKNIKASPKKSKKINLFKVFFAVFMAYFVYTAYNQQVQINKYNSQISMYKQDISTTNKLTSYYKSQASNMQTDDFIEKMAREKLGYVKPYEKIFVDINKK